MIVDGRYFSPAEVSRLHREMLDRLGGEDYLDAEAAVSLLAREDPSLGRPIVERAVEDTGEQRRGNNDAVIFALACGASAYGALNGGGTIALAVGIAEFLLFLAALFGH